MNPLQSVEQAAEFLGISQFTVRAYLRDGKLKPTRIGRRVLLRQEELERFVMERTIPEPSKDENGQEIAGRN